MTAASAHFRMARLRIDRALLSLPRESERSFGEPIDSVVLSRLIIALNSIATGLRSASECEATACKKAAMECADILWSVGEIAGQKSSEFLMPDDSRPSSA